jgi:hypothetical protein
VDQDEDEDEDVIVLVEFRKADALGSSPGGFVTN